MGEARQLHPFVLSLRKGRRASGGDPPAYPLRVLSKHERSAKPKPSGVARQLKPFVVSLSNHEWLGAWIAGGCPAASHFFLLRQRKSNQKEGDCTDHTHR